MSAHRQVKLFIALNNIQIFCFLLRNFILLYIHLISFKCTYTFQWINNLYLLNRETKTIIATTALFSALIAYAEITAHFPLFGSNFSPNAIVENMLKSDFRYYAFGIEWWLVSIMKLGWRGKPQPHTNESGVLK